MMVKEKDIESEERKQGEIEMLRNQGTVTTSVDVQMNNRGWFSCRTM